MRRRLGALAMSASLLVACNAILGLDGDTVIVPADGGGIIADGATDGAIATADVVVPPGDAADAADAAEDGGDASDVPPGIYLAAGVLGGSGTANGPGPTARFRDLSAIAVDDEGHRYVVDGSGSVVRKVDAKTFAVSTLAGKFGDARVVDGPGAEARFERISGLVYDGKQSLYATEQTSCRLRRIDTHTGVTTTVFGHRDGSCGSVDGGLGLDGPTGVTFTVGDDVKEPAAIIADPPRLKALVVGTETMTTICGTDGLLTDGECKTVAIREARDLVFDPKTQDVFYRSDLQLHRFNSDKGTVTTLSGYAPSSTNDLLSSVSLPGHGLALVDDSADQLFIGNEAMVRLGTISNDAIANVAGSNKDRRWLDGPVLDARFEEVGALVRTGDGVFQVADQTTVRVLTSAAVQTIAGQGRATGYEDGTREGARIGLGFSFTLGPQGIVYFYDRPSSTVRSYDPVTGTVKTVAGTPGMRGETDGNVGTGLLNDESDGIVFDGKSIILSSSATVSIRSIDPATGAITTPTKSFGLGEALARAGARGVLSTLGNRQAVILWRAIAPELRAPVAGIDGSPGANDGPGLVARFRGITGICYDESLEAAFVADAGGSTIRKIQFKGDGEFDVSTLAGEDQKVGYVDGVGKQARFFLLDKIACDGKGHAYVNEREAGTVRRIDLTTGAVTTVAGLEGEHGILVGALPGRLNEPLGPLVLPNGHLLVGSNAEGAIVDIRLAP